MKKLTNKQARISPWWRSHQAAKVAMKAVEAGEAHVYIDDDGVAWYHDPQFGDDVEVSRLRYSQDMGMHIGPKLIPLTLHVNFEGEDDYPYLILSDNVHQRSFEFEPKDVDRLLELLENYKQDGKHDGVLEWGDPRLKPVHQLPGWLTVRQVAEHYEVPEQTVYSDIRRGNLPSKKPHGTIRIKRSDADLLYLK